MSINIENLSAKQLAALITQASQRKKKLAKRKPLAAVLKKLSALAKAEGYTLSELFGDARAAKDSSAKSARTQKVKKVGGKRGKVAAKYSNPANSEQTWSGRGKQPRWLAAEIASGKSLADFVIK